jgi:hypothetical protein
MAELNEAHFEIHSRNKDRLYQKRKLAEEKLKELLKDFDSDSLIDILMKLDDKS